MHALKIVVGAAAALMIGAAGAQTMHDSASMATPAQPWQVGEAYGGVVGHEASERQGAYGRPYDTSTLPAEPPARLTHADEAYDGKAVGASAEMERGAGAHGRPFSDAGLTRAEVMARIEPIDRSTALESGRLGNYVGGN